MHSFHPHAERAACPRLNIDLQTLVNSRPWQVEREWRILRRLYLRGCIMTSASKCCWAKSDVCFTDYMRVSVCAHLCIRLQVSKKGNPWGYMSYCIWGAQLPLSASFSVSPGTGQVSVSEEGHPLGIVLGTNTAAAFPLLYPSVGFGSLLWTTAQLWPGFSKHACTAARPLYRGLFCKYCRQQLNEGMERNWMFGLWTVGWLKHWENIIPTIFTSH